MDSVQKHSQSFPNISQFQCNTPDGNGLSLPLQASRRGLYCSVQASRMLWRVVSGGYVSGIDI